MVHCVLMLMIGQYSVNLKCIYFQDYGIKYVYTCNLYWSCLVESIAYLFLMVLITEGLTSVLFDILKKDVIFKRNRYTVLKRSCSEPCWLACHFHVILTFSDLSVLCNVDRNCWLSIMNIEFEVYTEYKSDINGLAGTNIFKTLM